MQSLGQEDPLEKEIASRSSFLAWEIPWAWRVQSMGLQRFGHTHTRVDMNFIKILENSSNCKNLLKNIVEWT